MNEILRVIFLLAALISGLIGYFLVLGALFAQRAARTQAAVAGMPGRALGIGAVNFVFFSIIAFLLFSVSGEAGGFVKGVLALPALLITAALVIALSFGLAAVAGVVGERALPDASALKRSIWGTVFLALACALPVAGWFLMLPYAALTGVGAFILGFFQPKT